MAPAPAIRKPDALALESSRAFLAAMSHRRSIRSYSDEPVPWELIENAVRVAARAPSGANQQPWRFVIVADPVIKARARELIEAEERETYLHRASDEWLDALAPLGTDWHKDHITRAPYVAVVFAQPYGLHKRDGALHKVKHYYVNESVGIAVGFFLASLTLAGLSTLTHTPNPMGFLGALLKRPENERAFAVIPIGYAADGAQVPAIAKKRLEDVLMRMD
ncbi:MAG: nitroreductase family protein [Candidatus Eremiobacteraeota bacterium]|nr:nitroreductase family protein [Candidatus Eremiobacteraeota bacterium]MBC5826792.1 nitroreductase family protein [Candidatus Eremiobacteraeota bacterium]